MVSAIEGTECCLRPKMALCGHLYREGEEAAVIYVIANPYQAHGSGAELQ